MSFILRINGETVETYKQTDIAKAFAIRSSQMEFTDLTKRKGSASYKYEIPLTDHNRRIFGTTISRLDVRAKFAQLTDLVADIWSSGKSIVQGGKVVVLEIKNDAIAIIITDNKLNRLAFLSEKSLREIRSFKWPQLFNDGLDEIYAMNQPLPVPEWRRHETQDAIFPLVTYGSWFVPNLWEAVGTGLGNGRTFRLAGTQYIDGTTVKLPLGREIFGLVDYTLGPSTQGYLTMHDFAPAIFIRNIIEAMFRDAGYTLAGSSVLDSNDFKQLVLLYTGKTAPQLPQGEIGIVELSNPYDSLPGISSREFWGEGVTNNAIPNFRRANIRPLLADTGTFLMRDRGQNAQIAISESFRRSIGADLNSGYGYRSRYQQRIRVQLDVTCSLSFTYAQYRKLTLTPFNYDWYNIPDLPAPFPPVITSGLPNPYPDPTTYAGPYPTGYNRLAILRVQGNETGLDIPGNLIIADGGPGVGWICDSSVVYISPFDIPYNDPLTVYSIDTIISVEPGDYLVPIIIGAYLWTDTFVFPLPPLPPDIQEWDTPVNQNIDQVYVKFTPIDSSLFRAQNYLPDIKQMDFLKGLISLFNLQVLVDEPTKTVLIETYDNYFLDESINVDLSPYVKNNFENTQTPPDLPRRFDFKWTLDENDHRAFLEQYFERDQVVILPPNNTNNETSEVAPPFARTAFLRHTVAYATDGAGNILAQPVDANPPLNSPWLTPFYKNIGDMSLPVLSNRDAFQQYQNAYNTTDADFDKVMRIVRTFGPAPVSNNDPGVGYLTISWNDAPAINTNYSWTIERWETYFRVLADLGTVGTGKWTGVNGFYDKYYKRLVNSGINGLIVEFDITLPDQVATELDYRKIITIHGVRYLLMNIDGWMPGTMQPFKLTLAKLVYLE